MVGSSICRKLSDRSEVEIMTQTRRELDLCDQKRVFEFIKSEKPDEIILAAAKVGGIHANNTYPAEFIFQNLQIQNNIIHAAYLNGIEKLLFLGSSCIYPREATQPMRECALLSGKLEPTNEPYAIAKIAGIKMCESYNRQYGTDYRAVMPTNLYGVGDNYHPENSHVVPALLRRFHEAKEQRLKEVLIWGSGNPRREFLFVDDMAEASLFIHNFGKPELHEALPLNTSHINVGIGKDITIRELAQIVKKVVDYNGDLAFDASKPDGPPQKLLDVSILNQLGWSPMTELEMGLRIAYEDFKFRYFD